MYHTRKNPLRKVTQDSEAVETARSGVIRRTHKAFLRYHDPENWELLRTALKRMGRGDLIGSGVKQLVPAWSPNETSEEVRRAALARSNLPPTVKSVGSRPINKGAVVQVAAPKRAASDILNSIKQVKRPTQKKSAPAHSSSARRGK